MADAPPIRDRPVWAYAAVFLLYVVLGYNFRTFILNWIIGPTFLFLTLYVIHRRFKRGRRQTLDAS